MMCIYIYIYINIHAVACRFPCVLQRALIWFRWSYMFDWWSSITLSFHLILFSMLEFEILQIDSPNLK